MHILPAESWDLKVPGGFGSPISTLRKTESTPPLFWRVQWVLGSQPKTCRFRHPGNGKGFFPQRDGILREGGREKVPRIPSYTHCFFSTATAFIRFTRWGPILVGLFHPSESYVLFRPFKQLHLPPFFSRNKRNHHLFQHMKTTKHTPLWLDGSFKYFLFSSLIWGNDPKFDEHIFQMGWFNHQLALKTPIPM